MVDYNKILNYIKKTLLDIEDDYNNVAGDAYDEWEESGYRGGDPSLYAGTWKVIWPQLLGFVVGLAVARLFKLDTGGYFVFGLIFAVVIGTYKSCSFDRIDIKHAFARNLMILAMIAIVSVSVLIFGWIFGE